MYRVNITATAITNAATVVAQGTPSAAVPIRIHRIELQTNQTGSTQSIIPLQMGTYTTGTSTGGATPTPSPTLRRNTVAAASAWRVLTATMGTTFALLQEWQWNGATPFDMVFGKDATVPEIEVSKPWALIIPSASGTPTVSGSITFEEM
jgi:hypothetical protein